MSVVTTYLSTHPACVLPIDYSLIFLHISADRKQAPRNFAMGLAEEYKCLYLLDIGLFKIAHYSSLFFFVERETFSFSPSISYI
jgi:hypothetical protein